MASLEEDDLRKAIIYASIGYEVFIKEYTENAAKEAGVSPVFWEYLNHPNTETRVLTYYNEVLHLVMGHSLKEDNIKMHQKLQLLFTARNKIMHEGKIPSTWNASQIVKLKESITACYDIISWVRQLDAKTSIKS